MLYVHMLLELSKTKNQELSETGLTEHTQIVYWLIPNALWIYSSTGTVQETSINSKVAN